MPRNLKVPGPSRQPFDLAPYDRDAAQRPGGVAWRRLLTSSLMPAERCLMTEATRRLIIDA